MNQLKRALHAAGGHVFRVLSVVLVTTFAYSFAGAADDKEFGVIGRWKLTAALDASEIAALDEREAAQLIGRVVVIRKDKVQFGARVCPAPELSAQRVETNLFMREEAHASATLLGLPNPVTVVELGCTTAFIKGRNRLVLYWDGWFFDAKRESR